MEMQFNYVLWDFDETTCSIFISHDGGIKITNFDVLKYASDSQIMMKTVCGTTLWMAPEMLGEHDYTRKVTSIRGQIKSPKQYKFIA